MSSYVMARCLPAGGEKSADCVAVGECDDMRKQPGIEGERMKKVDLYVCEICGTQYKEKQKCQDCEKSHIRPVQITGEKYMPKHCNGEYPVHITIRMADGKYITYKR